MHRFDQLTARQEEVLDLIASGYSNQEIASRLHLSVKTVKNYVGQILISVGVRNRTAAAVAWVTRTPPQAEPDQLAEVVAAEVTKQLAQVLTPN